MKPHHARLPPAISELRLCGGRRSTTESLPIACEVRADRLAVAVSTRKSGEYTPSATMWNLKQDYGSRSSRIPDSTNPRQYWLGAEPRLVPERNTVPTESTALPIAGTLK
jgi:hypothetical protein